MVLVISRRTEFHMILKTSPSTEDDHEAYKAVLRLHER